MADVFVCITMFGKSAERDRILIYNRYMEKIVRDALVAGKYAIFADCGLGKTLMQLEWADNVYRHTGRPVIVVAPLAVSAQTIAEGAKFGFA